MKLLCETNTQKVDKRIKAAFRHLVHRRPVHTVFEHGQWWVCEPRSGGIWSVCDGAGPGTVDGLCFELIEGGDKS